MNSEEESFVNLLIKKGVISEEQLSEALAEKEKAQSTGVNKTISQILLDKNFTSIEQLTSIFGTTGNDGSGVTSLPEEVIEHLSEKNSRVGKYIIVNEIGKGGMGVVYKAYDTILKRYIALKVLHSATNEHVKRFKREAEIVARLDYNGIVPIYETGSYGNRVFIAMKYIEGDPLINLVGKLRAREAIKIISRVCDVVSYSHKMGVIHRDIKPHNILVDRSGNVFVTDFGIAKRPDIDMTKTGDVIGTPAYLSPEQARGDVIDHRSDIYSIGATLYHCLTGICPFTGESSGAIISKVIEQDPIPVVKLNRNLHKDIHVIVSKAMAKETNQRYQSALQLKQDLDRFLSGLSIGRGYSFIWYLIYRKLKKYRIAILVGIVAVILAVISWFPLSKRLKEKTISEITSKEQSVTPLLESGNNYMRLIKIAGTATEREYLSGWIESALNSFNKVLEADSSNSEAYQNRAKIYLYYLGRFDEALEDYSNAIKHNPNSSEAYYGRILSRVFVLIRDLVERGAAPASSYDDDMSNDLRVLAGLNTLPARLKCAQAVTMVYDFLKTILTAHNSNNGYEISKTHMLMLIGMWMKWQQVYTDTVKLLTDSIAIDPAFADAYLIRGTVKIFNFINLIHMLETEGDFLFYGIADVAGFVASNVYAGTLELVANFVKADSVLSDIKKAIAIEPNIMLSHKLMYLYSYLGGKYEDAFNAISNIREITGDSPDIHLLKAWLFYRQGKTEEIIKELDAISGLETRVKDRGHLISLLTQKAMLESIAGLKEESLRSFKTCLELSGESKRGAIMDLMGKFHTGFYVEGK